MGLGSSSWNQFIVALCGEFMHEVLNRISITDPTLNYLEIRLVIGDMMNNYLMGLCPQS